MYPKPLAERPRFQWVLCISLKLICVTTVRGLFWWEQERNISWNKLRHHPLARYCLSLTKTVWLWWEWKLRTPWFTLMLKVGSDTCHQLLSWDGWVATILRVYVVALSEREGTLCEESWDRPAGFTTEECLCSKHFCQNLMNSEKEVASMLQIPKCNLTEEQPLKLIDCAVEFHAAFASEDGEIGEFKGVEHVLDMCLILPCERRYSGLFRRC